jgi:RimJ/RimL family protein N-acetyltransferase
MKTLKDDGLIIRPATTEDVSTLCAWWADGKVMAHAGFPKGIKTDPNVLYENIKKYTDDNRLWIIEFAGVRIGEMNHRIKNGIADIGIKICDSAYQDKGLGTKALNLLLAQLFLSQNVQKITLDTNQKNARAQHVYEKIGFRKVRVKYDAWKDQMGNLQTSIDYEMTKEDYLRIKG